MTAKTKQVGFAYPTSDTAHRFGFGVAGCYFVLFLTGDRRRYSCRRDAGFATQAEAFNHAECQPEDYDYFSLRPDGSRPWTTDTPNHKGSWSGKRANLPECV